MNLGVLIFSPAICGLLYFLYQIYAGKVDVSSFSIGTWAIIAVGVVFIWQLIGILFFRRETPSDWQETLTGDEYLENATVSKVNGHTVVIEANGRKAMVTMERNGTAWVQKLDRQGHVVGPKTRGPDNAWKFGGKTPNQALMEYLRHWFNTGK